MGQFNPRRSTTFYCFSPLVMAVTFAAEMLLLMYVLAKHGYRSVEHRLVILLLLFLALFQLSEYAVCEGLAGIDSLFWARLGFVSITLLPPIGLHLIQRVRGDKNLNIAYISYFFSLVFVVAFTLFDSFTSIGCSGNYAIFELREGLGGAYFAYYYFLLFVGSVLAYMGWKTRKDTPVGRALIMIVTGYASFAMPATFIHFVFEDANNGLPSIMCGFALLFAILLATAIADRIPKDEA